MDLKRGTTHTLSKFIPLLNATRYLLNTKGSRAYAINSGVGYGGLDKFHYTERLVELPFLLARSENQKARRSWMSGAVRKSSPDSVGNDGLQGHGRRHKGLRIQARRLQFHKRQFHRA